MSLGSASRLMALAIIAVSELALAQTVLEPEQTVVDFDARWQWARESATGRSDDSAWVGFSFAVPSNTFLPRSLPSSEGQSWHRGFARSDYLYRSDYSDWSNYSDRSSYSYQSNYAALWPRSPSLNALLPERAAPQDTSRPLALVLRYASGRLMELHLIDPETGLEWRGLDIYWAGRAAADDALMTVRGLADGSLPPRLRAPLLLTLGLPDSARRFDLLTGLLTDPAWAADRVTLISSLSLQLTAPVETLLRELAGDANGAVRERRAAIAALARLDSARALLIDLSGPGQPLAVRRAALSGLAQHPGREIDRLLLAATAGDQAPTLGMTAVRVLANRAGQSTALRQLLREHPRAELREEVLDALVTTDPDGNFSILQWVAENDSRDNRREAIESLRRVSPDLAIPYLNTLVEDVSLPPRLRREAVESLARFAAERVRDRLNRLAWADQDEGVRAEAVEGLARLRELPANAFLLELAKNHPSPDTREEALEQLQETLF